MMEQNQIIQTDYKSQTKLLAAVDCIIFGFDKEELKVLLIKRGFEPLKGAWSLMGGFVKSNETTKEAASRVLYQLTGLHNVYMEEVGTFSDPDRDPVDRTISITYYALIDIESHNKELIKKYSASWFSLAHLPDLIFDHNEMVKKAIQKLRLKTSTHPIGFELLPPKFTMRQLHLLYEAILGAELDKRNFHKKMTNMDLLQKLDEKDMNSSKKGSFLYKFDEEKYRKKRNEGFSFRV